MPPKRKAVLISDNENVDDTSPVKSLKVDSSTNSTTISNITNNNATLNKSTITISTQIVQPNGNGIIDVRDPNLSISTPIFKLPTNSDNQTINWYFMESNTKRVSFDLKYQSLIEKSHENYGADKTHQVQIADNIFINYAEMVYHVGDNQKKPIVKVAHTPIWLWEKSRGVFSGFQADVSNQIEIAFLKDCTKGNIDAERYINFSTFEQVRFDDVTKTRRVQRSFIDTNLDASLQNPTWYYADQDTWVIYPDTIEMEKSFQAFLKNRRDVTFKSSNGDQVTFAPLGASGRPSIKRDKGSPDIVPITKKTYSQMSEEEKKAIITQSLLAASQPQPPPTPTTTTTSTTTSSSQLFLPGEEAIIEGNGAPMKYILRPCRQFDDSAADLHFRTAESQFYRLLESASNTYKVKKVEYIVNPKLMKAFYAKKKEYEKLNYPDTKPVFGFHGTSSKNILNICKTNFLISKVGSTTDAGWYGKGIYFSEYPEYSIGYISDCSKIMLCKVLLGKSYKCDGLITGKPCQTGYTSHLSPDEMELVIFHPDQILPCYVIHYDDGNNINSDGYTLYNDASKKHTSNIFSGLSISIIGTLSASQTQLKKLISDHGGSVTTSGSSLTHLVTNSTEFANKSSKITNAVSTNIPVVNEEWIYKSIIDGKLKNPADYSLQFKQAKRSTDIKAVPLDFDDDNVDGTTTSDSDSEDEVKKPMCKYGNKCYRKNADHFKQFDHEFLIG
ncbi:PARP domain-containing protein [Tieghemostelium lacteum]|uniref:Poly [ADP-ribose] polymerase n=1 Tax=Tieghemostelium lacteum TaxID=361077 RepID=A0A151Z7J0_TIELA|nr:PARP domain-containing protein [Tieghemostelium lacteum]|eukprot:KYQ89930.1 PARP domain-containing protein [Tieghemostelium lacteum]